MWKLVNNNWQYFAVDNKVISEPEVKVETVTKSKKTSRKSKTKVKPE